MDPEIVEAVLEDWKTAPVSERLRAGLDCAAAQAARPPVSGPEDLERWRAAGLDDFAIEDVGNIALHFNMINRISDAFDFQLADPENRPRHTRFLQQLGNVFGARRPEPSFDRGADGRLRPAEVNHGRERMLTVEGATEPSTRQAVEAYTAGLLGGSRTTKTPPETLVPYLDKLARHAHRIVDEDVDRLRGAGFDDEAIFEVTIVGALGAGLPAIENLFDLLYSSER